MSLCLFLFRLSFFSPHRSLSAFISLFLHLSLSPSGSVPISLPLFCSFLQVRGLPSPRPAPGPHSPAKAPGARSRASPASAQSRGRMLPAGGAQRRFCRRPPSPPSPGSRRPAGEEMLAGTAKIPGRLRAFWLQRARPLQRPREPRGDVPGWAPPQEGAALWAPSPPPGPEHRTEDDGTGGPMIRYEPISQTNKLQFPEVPPTPVAQELNP